MTTSRYMEYWRGREANSVDFEVQDILYREDNNFLEGFYYDAVRDSFYESSGLYGKSFVHRLNLDTSTSTLAIDETKRSKLDKEYFGEGIAPRSATEFALLTYKQRRIFIVDRDTMELKDQHFTVPKALREGWGLTADEKSVNENGYYRMYASDGSYKVFEIDGETMEVVRTIRVKDKGGKAIKQVNELEFIDGFIYANVWYKDILLKIDPADGKVVKEWDLTQLMQTDRAFQIKEKYGTRSDCLNGIAYDAHSGSIFLTGKNYYLVFKVKLY